MSAELERPAKALLHPWEWPERAWSRAHVDYAGPLDGLRFLILVDAYSKWMAVVPVRNATSQTTIEKLRTIFSTHSLPEMLVSDNDSVFEHQCRVQGVHVTECDSSCICFTVSFVLKWPSRESSTVFQGSLEKDASRRYWGSHSRILVSSTIDTPHIHW